MTFEAEKMMMMMMMMMIKIMMAKPCLNSSISDQL